VIDDDEKFDKWMAEYDRKRQEETAQAEAARAGTKGGSGSKPTTKMDKEEYLKKFGGYVE
jgi:hypothetical protein